MIVRNLQVKTFIALLTLYSGLDFTENDVRQPPSITESPKTEKIFRPGESFELTCRAEGIPEVTIAWMKNGEALNMNQSDMRRRSDGDITIDRASADDNGFYQCFSTNKYGTALSWVAHIRMATLAADPQKNPVNNVTVAEGRPFVIRAARLRSLPKPKYVWYIASNNTDHLPRGLFQSRRMQSACNGDLYFAYALKEDEVDGKLYKSTVQNPVTVFSSGGIYTRLTVTNDSGSLLDFPPNITYFSTWQDIALVGGSIILKCFFSGKPLPEITWSRQGNPLPSGRTVLSEFRTELTISGIEESDSGDYACTAKNALGNITHIINFPIEAVPKFTSVSNALRNINVTEGEFVTFNCSSYAKPEAIVSWFLNGQLIDVEYPPTRFTFSSDNESLTIANVCRDCVDRETKTDLMVIQCNASNVHGYAFASGYLNVLLKTKLTVVGPGNVLVDLQNNEQFVYQCSATSDPSTHSTVQWYKIEPHNDLVQDEPPYVNVTGGFLMISIYQNLSVESAKYLGEYKCIGDNRYSQDSRSITLSYQYISPLVGQEDIEESLKVGLWKIIPGTGALGLVLFLLGMYIRSRSRRGLSASVGQNKDRKLPSAPNNCDSAERPLEAISNEERSMTGADNIYEHIGYETIDQVLNEIAKLTEAMPSSPYSNVANEYNRYETIDALSKDVKGQGEPTLNEGTIYDYTMFSDPLEEVMDGQGKVQDHVNGYESVGCESGKVSNSNEKLESMNAYSELGRSEVNSYLKLGSTEDDIDLDLCSKEMNLYSDMDRNEVNSYLYMAEKEVDSTMHIAADLNHPTSDYLILEG